MKIKQLDLVFLSVQILDVFDFDILKTIKLFNKNSIVEFNMHCILGPGLLVTELCHQSFLRKERRQEELEGKTVRH